MFGAPEITHDEVLCEECGRWFQKITSRHLQRHDLTILEYKEKWGFCRNQPLESIRIKCLRRRQVLRSKAYLRLIPYKNRYAIRPGQRLRGRHYTVPEQERRHLEDISVNVQSGPRFRQAVARGSRRKWQQPTYRRRVVRGLRQVYRQPALRQRLRRQSKAWHRQPANKRRHRKALRKACRSLAFRRACRARMLRKWRTPSYRRKILRARQHASKQA
jgi:hypothetical protein